MKNHLIVISSLLPLFFGASFTAKAATYTIGPRENVLTVNQRPYAWPDGTLGVLKNGSTYTFWGAEAGDNPIKTVGTLDNPVVGGWETSPINNRKHSYDYIGGGPVYKDPQTETLLMFYHAEIHINGNWTTFYSKIGMAKSTDGGNSWSDLGEILTPHAPLDSNFQGAHDMMYGAYLIIGDYFYVYFSDRLTGADIDEANVWLGVARARVSDVVNAAVNQNNVVSWTKYYNGSWSEPGIGGQSSPLEPTNSNPALDVSYNSYLGRYVGTSASRLLESSDGINWSVVGQVDSNAYYGSLIGLGDDPRVTSQQFYVYYIYSVTGNRNTDGILSRRLITIDDGGGVPSVPTLTLSATPTSIQNGQSATLTWSTTNASSCSAGGGWSGTKSTSGSQTVSPTVTTSYALACTGSGGSVTKSVTVTVGPTPSATCPAEATYPTDRWDRVWCDKNLYQKSSDTPDEFNEKFDNNWGTGSVGGMQSDNIGFRSGRTINAPVAGPYNFSVGSDDGVRLRIDGTLVLDRWLVRAYAVDSFSRTLAAGAHRIGLDYYEAEGDARVSFNYSSPSSAAKPGDLNNDSRVDVTDLGILLSNWGKTTKPPADLNQDGRVDIIDLGILLSNWG